MADPVTAQPVPGPVVPKEPPPNISEDPPAQKPDIDNVQWVPGYWAGDAPQQQFLWISGVYRVPPQDRNYIPGYWTTSEDGCAGCPDSGRAAKYRIPPIRLSPPLARQWRPDLEAPTTIRSTSPGPDLAARSLRLAARLLVRRAGWPRLDSALLSVDAERLRLRRWLLGLSAARSRRDVAPVYFSQPLWNNSNWSYQPSYVVSPSSFLDSAFTNGPGFYFGNYYGNAGAGFNPWYAGRGRYDPTFGYNGLKNPAWLAGARQNYAGRMRRNLERSAPLFRTTGQQQLHHPPQSNHRLLAHQPRSGQRYAQRTASSRPPARRHPPTVRSRPNSAGPDHPHDRRTGRPRITNGSSTAGRLSPRITTPPHVTPSSSGQDHERPINAARTFNPCPPPSSLPRRPAPPRLMPPHAMPPQAPAPPPAAVS